MNSRNPKKKNTLQGTGRLVDVFKGVKPGQTKEIAPNLWAINLVMVPLDPPEPIKKPGKAKPKKK